MITSEYRPRVFDDVVGQKSVVLALKSIAKNPQESPRTLIFQGAYGCGKTSCARVFARALNCENPKADGSPCGKCSNCTRDILSAYFYQEYDAAIIGNVDEIRRLRDTFSYSITSGYRVIVLDETQLCSKQAQSALLKVIEEVGDNTFFIFATTDVDAILNTIRSRSLELRFGVIPQVQIKENLSKIADELGIVVDDNDLDQIARDSGGHMRNAHMLLDKYRLVGKAYSSDFAKIKDKLIDYLVSFIKKDTSGVTSSVFNLSQFPLVDVKSEYETLLNDLIKASLGMSVGDPKVEKLAGVLGSKTSKLVRMLSTDWIMQALERSDIMMQTALLSVYQMYLG